jgi:hypothetical protein
MTIEFKSKDKMRGFLATLRMTSFSVRTTTEAMDGE